MGWRATIEEYLIRRQRERGDPASMEEILHLHDALEGEVEVSPEERQRLLERTSVDPEAARRLLHLLRFPDLPEGSEDPLAPDEVEERWSRFRDRLVSAGKLEPVPHPATPTPSPSMRFRSWPLAASFLVGALVAWMALTLLDPIPSGPDTEDGRVNLHIVELLDDGTSPALRRGELVQVPSSAEGLVVTLASSDIDQPGPFDLRVLDRSGMTLLYRQGLVPGPGGVFVLSLPREILADGTVHLRLYLEGEQVAVFVLDMVLLP